jgi:signal peptidase II
MMTLQRKRLSVTLIILLVSTVLDQLTKRIAIENLRFHAPLSYLGNLFRLEYSENPGAFLSLGSALPESARFWILNVAVAVALLGLFVYVVFYSDATIRQALGMILLVSGGVSNLLDRMFRANGRVVDFMNMGIGDLRTGIFNVADMLIMLGVGLTLLWGSKASARAPEQSPAAR